MKPLTFRYVGLCAALALLSGVALGQLTINATGAIRDRQRNPDTSSGGGVGKKVPLLITVEVGGGGAVDQDGKTEIDFILTNAGKADLIIPISPHPGDLEPSDPKADYAVQRLSLYVIPSKGPNILPGGANLYGNSKVPGTLETLSPGNSIRIQSRIALPPQPAAGLTAVMFHAGANLSDEAVKVVNGKRVLESHVNGSAYSHDFTLQSLFSFPK